MAERSLFFQRISLETTARGAARFIEVADRIPDDALINMAAIEADSLETRLAAIDRMRAAGLRPRPILSARRMPSGESIVKMLDALDERGVGQLFLVGGDPLQPAGPFEGARAVIQGGFLDARRLDGIGLPGYPEGHPIVPHEDLMGHLQTKVELLQGKGFRTDITTQICIDPLAVVDWIEQVRGQGILSPIRIGVPSPTTLDAMMRFCRLCRVEVSVASLQRYDWIDEAQPERVDPSRFMETILNRLTQDLGPVHMHLFPMGDLAEALAWFHSAFSSSTGGHHV